MIFNRVFRGRLHLLVAGLLAAFVAAAILGGCGGGGDSEDGSTAAEVAGANGSQGTGSGESESQAGKSAGKAAQGDAGSEGGSAKGSGGGAAGSSPGGEGSSNSAPQGSEAPRSGSENGGGSSGAQGGSGKAGGGKSQFVAKADEICHKWGKTIQADVLKSFKGDLNGSKKEINEGVESLVANVEKYVVPDLESEQHEVSALGASGSDDREAQSAVISALDDLIGVAKSTPDGLVSGSPPQVQEAEAQTRTYGFSSCGKLVG